MDGLDAIGDPELRQALAFARSQARSVSADELAAEQGVHRNVARSRLERLVAAGLLAPGYERRTGRSGPGAGRPAKVYAVLPELTALEFPARRYEALLGLLVDALPASKRPARLREIGVAFGEELGRSAGLRPTRAVRAGFEQMCEAVRRLGYQVSVEEASDRGAVLATPTCPLRPLVRARPDAAEIDRGMWQGLAAQALDGMTVDRVRCETRDCLLDHASCRVVLTLQVSKSVNRV
jgi:predicted ArsR family transcriptional regulator